MKNIVVIHNPKDLKVYDSWKHWCSKYGYKLFILNESVLEDPSFDKFLIFNILEESNIEYNQILITNPHTIVNPNSPDIFNKIGCSILIGYLEILKSILSLYLMVLHFPTMNLWIMEC